MKRSERIKDFREKKGLTQEDLAKIIECDPSYISQIENEIRKPSIEFLEKLHEIFGVSTDYILYGTTEEALLEFSGVSESPKPEYYPERRQPENALKRRLIDKVLRILDSGNKKALKALKSNIDYFFSTAVEPIKVEVKEDD